MLTTGSKTVKVQYWNVFLHNVKCKHREQSSNARKFLNVRFFFLLLLNYAFFVHCNIFPILFDLLEKLSITFISSRLRVFWRLREKALARGMEKRLYAPSGFYNPWESTPSSWHCQSSVSYSMIYARLVFFLNSEQSEWCLF